MRVGENVGRAREKYMSKKFKWVHVYGITTIIICMANDVAQLSDACALYACWADAINMENMDLALSNTSLMSPACVASNSLNNRTIPCMKEATGIPEALKASRTLLFKLVIMR